MFMYIYLYLFVFIYIYIYLYLYLSIFIYYLYDFFLLWHSIASPRVTCSKTGSFIFVQVLNRAPDLSKSRLKLGL